MTAALAKVRDYLTMRAESERSARVTTDDKPALARALIEVREARRAAEVLWGGACPAFAWRTSKSAFDAALEAARAAAGAEPIDDVVKALGLRARDAAKLRDIVDRLTSIPSPSIDADVGPAHVEAFPVVRDVVVLLERAVVPFASDARTLRFTKIRRQIVTAALVLLAIASLVFFVRMQFRTWATASASVAPKHDATNAIDFSPEGEWLLPDATAGWIDVHYSPSRTVTHVHLLNAHASIYNDRGTKDFTIELYGHDHLLESLDGTFPEFSSEPKTMTWDVGRTPGVDRLRVVVKSWYFRGGGLAEISVD